MLQSGETGVRQTQTPSASETRPAHPHGWTLQPMQHHRWSITSMLRRKWRGDILSSLPGLHYTIPSGKDTGRRARPSYLCMGRSTGHNWHDKRLWAQRRHKTTTLTCKRWSTLRVHQQINKHTLHCWNPSTCQYLPQGGDKDNNFIHDMARPAGGLKLRHHSHRHQPASPPSHNHQRCRRRRGHVSVQTRPNSQREIRSF